MEFHRNGLEDLVGHDFDVNDGVDEGKSYGVDASGRKNRGDVSALEARNGRDIQGINWEGMRFTREEYHEARLKQYKNYVNLSYSLGELKKECMKVEKGNAFYEFQYNTRLVKPTITHLQLRNLIWATSKNDLYFVNCYSIIHWSSLRQTRREVLNVSGRIAPNVRRYGTQAPSIARVRVSTMCVKDCLMVAGGFQGELLCKRLNNAGVLFCSKLTSDENAITNGVDIFESSSGSARLMTANNDRHVRVFDAERFTLHNQLLFPWSVNNTSVSPDGKLLAVLGDSTDCLLVDAQSGKELVHLRGHLDYLFSSAWHPEGHVLATGSQDKTCRLWDVRNLSKSFAVLQGRMAAIRTIKFTSDGKFMAAAEAADSVHLFDAHTGYNMSQEINFFGEIAGISFSPDTEALFVGVSDRSIGSLMEFKRKHEYQYLDSYY